MQTPALIKIAQDLSEMRIDSSFAEADIGKIKGRPESPLYRRRFSEP